MNATFRQRLRAGETLLGTLVSLDTPASAEILAETGFDWLFLDGEHGPFDNRDIAPVLQAVGGRAACVVRVAAAEEAPIKRALDQGADGIVAPMINSAEDARRVVDWARYAPEGSRGVGVGRAHGYGMRFREYLEEANDKVAVIVQVEHAEAVANIESIVSVEGIDGVFVGPYDLSASMGKMGEVDHPEVVAAVDRVTEVCRATGMPLGYFGFTAESVRPYLERGYTLVVAGVDAMFLGQGARDLLADLEA